MAFLASITSSTRQCKFLDQNFVWDTISQHSHVSRALTAYNGIVLAENQVVLTEASSKLIQKELSEAIDKASIRNIMDSSDFLQKAHFNLESAPRAGSWLNAIPSESSGNKVQGILFCYMLKRRL